ncbi:MAG: single-stranded DNA-binding protein [Acutalibacteraceae bacterium]
MNHVSLIGRLTADPELKYTQNNLAVVRFSIAVDRTYTKAGQERQVDFINITAWNKTAEFICKYFQKGRRIALTGQIRTGSYTDKDGNKRYTFEVWADNVEFCDSKQSNSGDYQGGNSYSNYQTPQPRQEAIPSAAYSSGSNDDFQQMPTDEDLPF